MPTKVRVGAVSYLNTKPLIYRLAELAPQAELVLDVPSRLADGLERGTLDVALVPSIECFRHPAYEIVSDACIATRGPVLSVKLLSRVPLEEIASLALDEGSRTSVVLVQIILAERYGVRPRTEPLPLGTRAEDAETDAVLLIGDRAIHEPGGAFATAVDLGQEWTAWTGLPFVFALWAARPGADLRGADEALSAARDLGLEHVDEIVAREAPAVGLSAEACRRYLGVNLHFTLGRDERRGLQRFYTLAARAGFVPEGVELVFGKRDRAHVG